jgi:hypothetical protein
MFSLMTTLYFDNHRNNNTTGLLRCQYNPELCHTFSIFAPHLSVILFLQAGKNSRQYVKGETTMKRRTKIIGAALGIAVIATMSLGGMALADDGDVTTAPAPCGNYELRAGNGFGGEMSVTVSELLGLTTEELQALRLEGKSLAAIAESKGITVDALVAAIMETKTEAVEARVAAGTLTRERADVMLQQMEQRTVEAVNRTQTGPAEWRMGGNGNAKNGNGTGQGNAARQGRGGAKAGAAGMSRLGNATAW